MRGLVYRWKLPRPKAYTCTDFMFFKKLLILFFVCFTMLDAANSFCVMLSFVMS